MDILITGANGFLGSHLYHFLKNKISFNTILCTDIQSIAYQISHFQRLDLLDKAQVEIYIKKYTPEQIFHFAGSFSNNYTIDYQLNVLTTQHLLEAVREHSPESSVILVGSAAEYGVTIQNPIAEHHPLQAVSIYGLSKVYQTHLMKFYVERHQLNIMMGRPFNVIGKGCSPKLFIGKMYEQIELYKKGKVTEIKTGYLGNKRDYLPVKDVVKHFWEISEHGKKGETYNIGAGYSVKMSDLLQKILISEGLTFDIVRPQFTEPSAFDVKDIYADIKKLKALTNS